LHCTHSNGMCNCCVYSAKTPPDDGQRNCLKHVEFYAKKKFEKLVHLFGFVIRIYCNAQSPEHQIDQMNLICFNCVVMPLVLCWVLNNNCTLLNIVSHSFCSLRVASVNITVAEDVKFPSEQVTHAVSLPSHLYTCAPSARATLSTVGGTSYAHTYHYRCEIHSFCLVCLKRSEGNKCLVQCNRAISLT
jgi:hypothetical protein